MTKISMMKLRVIVESAFLRIGATFSQFDKGEIIPPVLITHLSDTELKSIRVICKRYHKGEGVTYEECMKAYNVYAVPEENGALFIDFPGSHYQNGLGMDILPAHTHDAGRVVVNVGQEDGIFHVIDTTGRYREHHFKPGDVVAFTGSPHTFTTKKDLEVLAFHLPFYDIENDPRAFTLYNGTFK